MADDVAIKFTADLSALLAGMQQAQDAVTSTAGLMRNGATQIAASFGALSAAYAEARDNMVHAAHVAHARKFVALSLPKAKSPDQIVDAVRKWVTTDGDKDLAAAIALANASNNNVTLPCWTALQAFVKQVETVPSAESLPSVHLATDIEIATDLMIALQANSPVVASCQALANYQKMSAVNMVAGIITGALSLSALPLPAIQLPLP
jgi:hypothetical protein